MLTHRSLLMGFLLLTAVAFSHAQTVAEPSGVPVADPGSTPPAATPAHPVLWRIGLNPGRSLRAGYYYQLGRSMPITAGAEYLLSPKFTLYSQLDVDFNLIRPDFASAERYFRFPGAALGLGARYYYNQAGRVRHNRAHGPFVGNYLALEARAETSRLASFTSRENSPRLLLLWGAQRRLGRHFLLDLNAGAGLGYFPSRGTYSPGRVGIATQISAGLYFGR